MEDQAAELRQIFGYDEDDDLGRKREVFAGLARCVHDAQKNIELRMNIGEDGKQMIVEDVENFGVFKNGELIGLFSLECDSPQAVMHDVCRGVGSVL